MKKNKFSKALKHLKSKKIDEKIKSLEEAAPTNNMSGVYQVTPSTGDAFRMGEVDPARTFYPKADGTWPAGIPANAGDRVYVKGAGYHTGKGAVAPTQTITPRDFSIAHMNANGNDTSTMIRASDGMVYSDLPEGTRNFILGPLVTSYTQNHIPFTDDDFTNIGYLQKDTRQFVLLARIQGYFDGSRRADGRARTWDGTSTQFTAFNNNFTLEHALWMLDAYNTGNFTENVPFNLSGGIPADRHPDNASLGGGDAFGTDGANAGGDGDDDGKNQDPADINDIESLDLWGLIKDVLDEIGGRFKGVLGVLDAVPAFLNFLAHQVNENSPWTDENPFEVKINEAERDAVRNDIEEIFNEWGNDRVDEINEGSPMTPEEQNQVNEKINRNKTDGRGDALDAQYPGTRLTLNNIGKPDAFKGNIQTNSDGTRTPIAIDDNYVFEGDADASAPGAPDIIKFMLELPGVQEKIEKSDLNYPYRKDSEDSIDEFGTKEEIKNKNMPIRLDLTTNTSLIRRESLNLNRKRILREVRQPLKEIKELPKTTKLKGYRPNFKGKYSPQNTPDVTASKQSDDIVSGKNASRQVWTAKDKFWKGYETTERMNIIYDNLGFGSQYFDRIVGENVRLKGKKSRDVQEHLNMLAHQKAMREVYGIKEYENIIDESETFDNKVNDPLFSKVAKRLKKEIDYPMKPAAKGYPNEEPPKVDPNTGYHPKFGKRYKYDKLDPHSAKTMAGAPTGDPEIDANVKKAAKVKEDWRSDLKNLWLGSERKEWKKKIEEDYVNTTQGMKVGQTFTHVPSGQTVTTSGVLGGIETLQTSVPIFGDEIPGPSESQYGLQGFAKPIDIMRRGKKKTEELNKELDSSEDYTKEIKADKFMKGRVEDSVDSALLSDLGYKSTEDILAEVGDQWTYEEYMAMLDAIADKAAAKEDPIVKKILEYSPTGKTPGDVPISLIDAQEAITNARNKAEQALHQAWERYNKVPDLPDGGEEPIAKSRRSNYTSQEIAQNRENLKNSIITTATGVIDGARNLNRVNYALNLAKRQSVKSGGSTQITTIPPDSLGGKNNPVETKMHSQSKKAFIKSIDLNSPKDIASQIVDNSADAAAYALGFKAVHSQIPTEGGSQENNVKLNSKGDLEMFDNYAFRPDGYMDTGIAKAAKFFGGTELQKDAATLIDKAGPVGWLSHALLGDIPDRQDPAVRIKTTITKKELIKILGAADYKIFVNRMNKEKKKRKVNESNTFSKIKKFKNKY